MSDNNSQQSFQDKTFSSDNKINQIPVNPVINQPATNTELNSNINFNPSNENSKSKKSRKKIFNLKTILSIFVLFLIVLGGSAGFYLSQQTQDLRQQASGGVVCSSSTTQTSCGSRPGCDWTPAQVACGPGDCSKPGCDTGFSQCTLDNCSSHAICEYTDAVPAQTGNCGSLGNSACNSQSGCNWQDTTWNSCNNNDCAIGKNGCQWDYTQCTINTLNESGCSPTYSTGSCSGVKTGCTSRTSESSCETAPGSWFCHWSPGSVNGASGSYQNGCSGGYHTGTARCSGGSYQISPAVPASCEGFYPDATQCTGTYTSTTIGSCSGTPTAYCSTFTKSDCLSNGGYGCIPDTSGGSCDDQGTDCERGDSICTGDTTFKTCNLNGTWGNNQSCSSGNECKESTGHCIAPYCDDRVVDDCVRDNLGCEPNIEGGKCEERQDECTRGQNQCNDANSATQFCKANGSWSEPITCPSGKCAGSNQQCVANCKGIIVQDCLAEGLSCIPDMNGGHCEARGTECVRGDYKCNTSNDTLQSCNTNGTWASAVNCSTGYECIDPSSTCVDTTTDYCREICIAKGSTPLECSSLPSCPEDIGTINACTNVPNGGACVSGGKTGTCSDVGECEVVEIIILGGGESCTEDNQCISGDCLPNSICDGPVVNTTIINDDPDPLSLSQDPLMAAVLETEKADAINQCILAGNDPTYCNDVITQAYNTGAETGDTCVTLYLTQHPSRTTSDAQEQCDDERARAIIIAGTAYAGSQAIPGVINTASSTLELASALGQGNIISSLLSLPTAGTTIATNALSSAPAWAPTLLRGLGTAVEAIGVGYGYNACVEDDTSDECLAITAAFQAGYVDFSLVDDVGRSAYRSIIANSTDNLAVNTFGLSTSGAETYKSYIRNYGELPDQLYIPKDPNDIYSMQSAILNRSSETNKSGLIDDITTYLTDKGAIIKTVNCSGATCRPPSFLQRLQGKKGVIEVASLEFIEDNYQLSRVTAADVLVENLGHEGGHFLDLTEGGINVFSNSNDIWASELRQQYFSNLYWRKLNSRYYKGPREFIDIVKNRTNIILP